VNDMERINERMRRGAIEWIARTTREERGAYIWARATLHATLRAECLRDAALSPKIAARDARWPRDVALVRARQHENQIIALAERAEDDWLPLKGGGSPETLPVPKIWSDFP